MPFFSKPTSFPLRRPLFPPSVPPPFSSKRPASISLWFLALIIVAIFTLSSTFSSFTSPASLPRFRFLRSKPAAANLAYFIQIVPGTLPHLPRLFRRVYHPENVYALHFDMKIPQSDVEKAVRNLRSIVPTYDQNTYLVPPDVIVYNGVSMILNTLAAMTYLLDLAHEWHFFINLSGSDYPLTNADLPRRLLARALPYSPVFFSIGNSTGWISRFIVRSKNLYLDPSLTHSLRDLPDLIETPHLNPLVYNMSFVPVHAEAWMILSRAFVHYLTHAPTARRMLVSLANMRGADEFFFASLAYNHPVFNQSLVPHSFRKVIWKHQGVHAGQHPYQIDLKQNGTFVFQEQLRNSVQWHARKFLESDSPLMDSLDSFANDPQRIATTELEFQRVLSRLQTRLKQKSSL